MQRTDGPRLRDFVRQRAGDQCEYCGLRQEHQQFHRFHIEHVIPLKHGGGSNEGNLALACRNCNLHKGPNLTGIDPNTGAVVELFDPRKQQWPEHFRCQGAAILGTTAVGRATVRVLSMNDEDQMELRMQLGYGKNS